MRKIFLVIILFFGCRVVMAADDQTSPNSDGQRTYLKAEYPDFTIEESGRIARSAANLLEAKHYAQIIFNDSLSRQFFTNFFNSLDYNHMFFLQGDVDTFHRAFSEKLDDLTKSAEAQPAFTIYDLFKRRVLERAAFIQERINQPFDFSRVEFFQPDRNELPWPATSGEAEELWRLRLKSEFLAGKLNGETEEVTRGKIEKRYGRLAKTLTDFDNEEVMGIYLSALCNAYDPHSDYMIPSELRNFEIHNVKAALTGIGALLQSEDGYCKIKSLTPGGPAEKSKKLSPNDRIVAVAQGEDGEWVDVIEEKLSHVVELIRGEMGTMVRLEIIPAKGDGSTRKVVSLVRDLIRIESQLPKARIYPHETAGTSSSRLGVIQLPQFHETTAEDVRKLVEKLKEEDVQGLILDLRHNGGGILQQAVELTGLFIDRGPVVQVRDNLNMVYRLGDLNPLVAYDGPLVVLVNRMSASASEIVAAALQDHGRALVIGDEHTHGKGTVQTLTSLDRWLPTDFNTDPGAMKYTVQKFYRIAGGTTQKYGVTPDLTLPSVLDYMEIGEQNLPNSLPADEIQSLPHRDYEMVNGYLGRLQKRSEARLKTSQEFSYIHEDIKLLKEQLQDRRVSLNLETREAEKKEREQRRLARKADRSGRPIDEEVIMEIDLKRIDEGQPMQSLAEVRRQEQARLAGISADEDSDPDEDEDMDSEIDPHLEEALNILADYVRLLRGEDVSGEKVASSRPGVELPASALPR